MCIFLFRCHKQWGKGCGCGKYVYPISLSTIIGKAKKSAVVLTVEGKKKRKEQLNEMEVIPAKYTVRKILSQWNQKKDENNLSWLCVLNLYHQWTIEQVGIGADSPKKEPMTVIKAIQWASEWLKTVRGLEQSIERLALKMSYINHSIKESDILFGLLKLATERV